MNAKTITHRLKIACLAIASLGTILWGCASTPADTQSGQSRDTAAAASDTQTTSKETAVEFADRCTVEYSCRFTDGTLLVTTRREVAQDQNVPKSDLFMKSSSYEPVTLAAGIDEVGASSRQPGAALLPFLHKKIADALPGLEMGKTARFDFADERMPRFNGESSDVRMKILRERKVTRPVPKDMFLRYTKGEPPYIGQLVQLEPAGSNGLEEPGGLTGEVVAIDEKAITLKHTVGPGDTFKTPVGPATVIGIRDDEWLQIKLDPQIDQVFRFGGMLGRVTEIDDFAFNVNFDYPFGGRPLQCDIVVRDLVRDYPEKEALVRQAQNDLANILTLKFAEAQGYMPEEVQAGDMVMVQYRIEDAQGRTWKENFDAPNAQYYPVVAGRPCSIPAVEKAVLGMRQGDLKSVTLKPENAFGLRDEKSIVQLGRTRTIPISTTMNREDFAGQFAIEPKVGARLDMPPFGYSIITAVDGQTVTFKLHADQKRIEHPYGTTEVTEQETSIAYRLTPTIGASFEVQGRTGIVTAIDDADFTVDLNHPLAGQSVTVSIVVREMVKSSDLAGNEIHWQEDLEQARTKAMQEKKSMAVVLYADWCTWCKRMFSETLTDPVITAMDDQFVWVRLNSDIQQEYKEMFGQQGFPLIVLMDDKGRVIEKRPGFQPVYPLWEALQRAKTRIHEG